MKKETKQYTEVHQRNGVTRRVPTSYHKPLGKTKTVSMTLPITIVEAINAVSEESGENKSVTVAQLVSEALEARGKES